MFYLTVIAITVVLICAGNLLFAIPFSYYELASVVFSTLLGVVAIIAIDGLSALIIRRLTPKSWYAPERKAFKVSKKERDFYRSIKIKKWKDKIPELGGFTGFHKDKLESSSDGAYLGRFILEANYGVVIHIANAILGFLIAFIPICSSPSIWVPIVAVNFVLSLLPVAILRYTSYTLHNLYARFKKKDCQNSNK